MYYRDLRVEELLAFFQREIEQIEDLSDNELSHLKPEYGKDPQRAFMLLKMVGIFNSEDALVGFCLLPSYAKTIVTSLYIGRQHRNRGFASWILNELKIETLNCLTDNTSAIRLYESLGFQRASITAYSIRFERNQK